jgi:hypothetical protein
MSNSEKPPGCFGITGLLSGLPVFFKNIRALKNTQVTKVPVLEAFIVL